MIIVNTIKEEIKEDIKEETATKIKDNDKKIETLIKTKIEGFFIINIEEHMIKIQETLEEETSKVVEVVIELDNIK